MPRRVIAIVTDELHGSEPIEQLQANSNGDGVEVRVVVPAVEANPLHHTMGDIDGPREQAKERLERVLETLRDGKVEVSGEIGDPDPVQAAQDALLKAPADEVLIFEHAEGQAEWYENGLYERAQESIEPPLRLVVLERTENQPDRRQGSRRRRLYPRDDPLRPCRNGRRPARHDHCRHSRGRHRQRRRT
jgi:hypothetical protein